MRLIEATEQAERYLEIHGLYDWKFDFDSAVARFGACHHTTKTITLSKRLTELNDEKRVVGIILHEIAHALAGHRAGHGPKWKETARIIGCSDERCYSTKDTVTLQKKVIGVCPNCGHMISRFRRSRSACVLCCNKYRYGRFDPKYQLEWS